MKLKDQTVEMRITEPLFLGYLFALDEAYRQYDTELTITSGSELTTKHSRTSLHYAGRAVDTRTWTIERFDLDAEAQHRIAVNIKNIYLGALGLPDDTIDIVLESTHMHHEWQPKYQA